MLIHAALLAASAKIEPITDRPLEIPRSASVTWIRELCAAEPCESQLEGWLKAVDVCESPIEVIMFLGLCAAFVNAKFPIQVMPAGSEYKSSNLPDREVLVQMFLQQPIRGYRIDIAALVGASVAGKTYRRKIAVECDGADFHSSPEQTTHDAIKDSVLLRHGFALYRFTGSDIWCKAQELCDVVVAPVLKKCIQLAKKGRL